MSRESDNAAIEARNAHRKARDGRRKHVYKCSCGKLVDMTTASIDQAQARKCGPCWQTINVEG